MCGFLGYILNKNTWENSQKTSDDLENISKKIMPKSRYLCEPQLGKRNLYNNLSVKGSSLSSIKYLDFLQYSDGNISLQQISKIINLNYNQTKKIYKVLLKKKLVL